MPISSWSMGLPATIQMTLTLSYLLKCLRILMMQISSELLCYTITHPMIALFQNIVNGNFLMAHENVISDILAHCSQQQPLIMKVAFITAGDFKEMRWLFPIVCLYYANSDAISTSKSRAPHTYSNTYSNTYIKACYYPFDGLPWLRTLVSTAPDSTRYKLFQSNDNTEKIDEIEEYWSAQYLSAGEAVWRILDFHVMKKNPAVTLLPIHMEHTHSHHQYHRNGGKGSTFHFFTAISFNRMEYSSTRWAINRTSMI